MILTFHPARDFKEVAGILRDKELKSARQAAWRILNTIKDMDSGVFDEEQNTKCFLAWMDHAEWLGMYGYILSMECVNRDMRGSRRYAEGFKARYYALNSTARPQFLTDTKVHQAHRSHLLRIDPVHYAQFFPTNTPMNLEISYGEEK